MIDKVLKSGRKVKIKEISEDQIAELEDIPEIYFIGDKERTIRNVNKANLSWIRYGLSGGEFDNWKPNGIAPPDHVIKQLTKTERAELIVLIQKCQIINPKKPSSLG